MSNNAALLDRARRVIPGGVNSPVRAFSAVEGGPPFIVSGEGPFLTDADGETYLDLVGSWGPLILGHRQPQVEAAVLAAVQRGTTFGAPTEAEVAFAEEICAVVPGMDQVRVVSSGTECTMHALRLARGATGRDTILKLDGCYHGAHDSVLVAAGSGVATFARPGSPGTIAPATVTAPFNDLAAAEAHLASGRIAAVILEPVAGNMGCIPPVEGYLEGLRALCDQHGSLLIFDEVMTGFRLALGGAAERFGVTPDLTCLGKVVGGGMPLAAFGGRRELMQHLSPVGAVYQAGTLSGNPVAVAAGRAALEILRAPGTYAKLEGIGDAIERAIRPHVDRHGLSLSRVGSMFTVFFRPETPTHFAQVSECDLARFGRFHRACLDRGVYLPCSQYEAAFLNLALTPDHVARIGSVVGEALDASANG